MIAQNSISLWGPNWTGSAGSRGTISPIFLKIQNERLSQQIALKGSIDLECAIALLNQPLDCFQNTTH